jgi:hypothetical protein
MRVPEDSLGGVEEILERAGHLDAKQVTRLATLQERMAMPRFRSRKAWQQATIAVTSVCAHSGRSTRRTMALELGSLAVLGSVIASAQNQGRDLSTLRSCMAGYRSSLEANDTAGGEQLPANLRSALEDVVGSYAVHSVDMACLAVTMATSAALTWDLAEAGGPYTLAQRELLMRPWLQVAGLPSCLAPCANASDPSHGDYR